MLKAPHKETAISLYKPQLSPWSWAGRESPHEWRAVGSQLESGSQRVVATEKWEIHWEGDFLGLQFPRDVLYTISLGRAAVISSKDSGSQTRVAQNYLSGIVSGKSWQICHDGPEQLSLDFRISRISKILKQIQGINIKLPTFYLVKTVKHTHTQQQPIITAIISWKKRYFNANRKHLNKLNYMEISPHWLYFLHFFIDQWKLHHRPAWCQWEDTGLHNPPRFALAWGLSGSYNQFGKKTFPPQLAGIFRPKWKLSGQCIL